jgi:hypothetical protein
VFTRANGKGLGAGGISAALFGRANIARTLRTENEPNLFLPFIPQVPTKLIVKSIPSEAIDAGASKPHRPVPPHGGPEPRLCERPMAPLDGIGDFRFGALRWLEALSLSEGSWPKWECGQIRSDACHPSPFFFRVNPAIFRKKSSFLNIDAERRPGPVDGLSSPAVPRFASATWRAPLPGSAPCGGAANHRGPRAAALNLRPAGPDQLSTINFPTRPTAKTFSTSPQARPIALSFTCGR